MPSAAPSIVCATSCCVVLLIDSKVGQSSSSSSLSARRAVAMFAFLGLLSFSFELFVLLF